MQHKVKLTVLDKKLYPELQRQYCADPDSGACPCYHIGDEFIFERYGDRDDFWHMGLGTLTRTAADPDTVAGGAKMPHCSEAWDAISRYIYTGLQGGSIMRGWMNDERVMITCCSDGTRPVIFRIERIDYRVMRAEDTNALRKALLGVDGVTEVRLREGFAEIYTEDSITDETLLAAARPCGVTAIE